MTLPSNRPRRARVLASTGVCPAGFLAIVLSFPPSAGLAADAAAPGPPDGAPPHLLSTPERFVARLAFGVDDLTDGTAGLAGDVSYRPGAVIGPVLAWALGLIPLGSGDDGTDGDAAPPTWSVLGGVRVGPPPDPSAPRVHLGLLAGAGRRAPDAMATVVVDERVVEAFPLLRFELRALGPLGPHVGVGPDLRWDVQWISIRRDLLGPDDSGTRTHVLEPLGAVVVLGLAGSAYLPGAAVEWSLGGGAALSAPAQPYGQGWERGDLAATPTFRATVGFALGAGAARAGAR